MKNEDMLEELLADSDSGISSSDASGASGSDDGEDNFSATAKPNYRRAGVAKLDHGGNMGRQHPNLKATLEQYILQNG